MPKQSRPRRTGSAARIPVAAPTLRGRAKARLRSRAGAKPGGKVRTPDKVREELRIHQVELEIQNEELRRAQFGLAQSRDHLAEIYDFSPVGYLSLDAAGIIRNANLTAATLLGVERGRLPGSRFFRFVAPGSQDVFFLHQRKLLAAGSKQHAEIELRAAGGRRPTVELQSVMRTADAGARQQWLMALIDVSERKAADLKIAALNHLLERRIVSRTLEVRQITGQFAAIVRSAMDAIISVDHRGRIILFNTAAERMFGRTSARMMGRPLDCLLAPKLRKRHREHLRLYMKDPDLHRSMGAGRPITGQRADGTTFPLEASISKVAVKGKMILTVIMRDISERIQAELVQRRHEEAMADFFSAAPLGLIWIGPDGKVQRINQVGRDLAGRSTEDVVGVPLDRLYPDRAAVALLVDRVTKGHTILNLGLSFPEQDGKERHLLVDANGYFHEGKLMHARLFVRDITERVRLQQQIIDIAEQERERIGYDLHDDLCQELVAIEYQNEALVKAWAPAAPALQEKGHGVSVAIRRAIDHARQLARGLSSNIEPGPGGLMTALGRLVAQTESVFGLACQFHCPLPVHIPDRKVAVHLFRIAQEAVSNAFRHAHASKLGIFLKSNDGTVILVVEDNGTGLPEGSEKSGGAGLHIMQYRTGIIRGSLVFERRKTGGTAVICTIRKGPKQESAPGPRAPGRTDWPFDA